MTTKSSSPTPATPEIPEELANMTVDQFKDIIENVVQKGLALYQIKGLTKEHMDTLYSLGYTYYNEGKYEDAEKIFRVLCLYDHLIQRNWIALGAACQMQKKYEIALWNYSYAALLDYKSPVPPIHAVECYLALKNYPQALAALESVILLANTPEYTEIKSRAESMRDILKENIKNTKKETT